MNNNSNLTINEIFSLAVKSHQEGKTDIAQKFYNQVINAEAASQSSLAPDQMYQDPLLRELKEKEKFKKKIKII